MITLRLQKGTELTHKELDDNFTFLNEKLNFKANANHTHSINEISGLGEELNNKIDRDNDVNVANGLVMLNESGKIPTSLLPEDECDCIAMQEEINKKISKSDLIDEETNRIFVDLLPDYEQMATDIENLNNEKASFLKKVRWIYDNDGLSESEDILFFPNQVDLFSLSSNRINGRVIKLVRLGNFNIHLESTVYTQEGTGFVDWTEEMPNSIELVCTRDSQWWKIG